MIDRKELKIVEMIMRLGVDNAAHSLSNIVKSPARVDVSDVHIVDISDVTRRMNINPIEVIGVLSTITGDSPIDLLFIFSKEKSIMFSDLMLGHAIGSTNQFDEYAKSAVEEISNILTSSIATMFANKYGLELRPAPPRILIDYSSTIFSDFLIENASKHDSVLILESMFIIEEHRLTCEMFLLPGADSAKILAFLSNAI